MYSIYVVSNARFALLAEQDWKSDPRARLLSRLDVKAEGPQARASFASTPSDFSPGSMLESISVRTAATAATSPDSPIVAGG